MISLVEKNAMPDCGLAMLKQNGEMRFHKLGHSCNTNYETKRRCANAVYHPAAHVMPPEHSHPVCLYVYHLLHRKSLLRIYIIA
jgi:hypothetical protein